MTAPRRDGGPITMAEARAILGDDLYEQIRAQPSPEVPREAISMLARAFAAAGIGVDGTRTSDAA